MHGFKAVRGMLSTLRHESMDKVWKSILEGSLFEARAGNIPVSRRLFKYLINHVPWYGPIYFEAFRLEEKEGNDQGALAIILKGLKELPRYGPLWFGLFRIMERADIEEEHRQWQRGVAPKLANLSNEAAEAVRSISKELTWKVHFEKSQAEERAAEVAALGMHQNTSLSLQECRDAMLGGARQSLVRSLMSCPGNLRWRVLLVGARMELGVGAVEKARFLLQRALQEVPGKSRSYVYLECSRVEEYLGNLDTARALLLQARQEVSREWKVYLEAVLVELRAGYVEKAAKVAREAVRHHSGTGRLWAMYIQLCHRLEVKYFNDTEKVMIDWKLGNAIESEEGKKTLEDIQNKKHARSWLSKECVILRAIEHVPKSGEVWCESARCQLNPLSVHCFDLRAAQLALSFATQFTPQYGDTFVEYVRLEMICQVLLPRVLTALGIPVVAFIEEYVSADLESDLGELPETHWAGLPAQDTDAVSGSQTEQERRRSVILGIERMQYDAGDLIPQYRDVTIKNLNRRYELSTLCVPFQLLPGCYLTYACLLFCLTGA
jgi:la-related protein 1